MSLIIKVKPEDVGFSSARLANLNRLIYSYIKQGLIPGAVAVIARQGKLVHFNAYGQMDIEQDKPMREETIFRIYSMTKPLTTIALLILYEQGHFQLSDPVSRFIPSFKHLKVLEGDKLVEPKREMTIHDLLIHTAGFSHLLHEASPIGSLYRSASLLDAHSGNDIKGFIQKLSEFPLAFHPGTYWHYSISYNVLPYLVELFSKMSFNEWIAKKITTPLHMLDTTFYVPNHKKSRLSVLYTHDVPPSSDTPVSTDPIFKLYRREETDDVLTPPSFLAGGGGLMSTATDYLRFCQMLLNQGELDGNRLVGRKSIELMTSQHLLKDLSQISLDNPYTIGLAGIGYGLGVGVMLDPAQAQILGTKGDYFWSGLANTSFFIDPQEQLIGLFLTQVHSSHQSYSFQRDFRVAVYQALLA